jgi:hypothetical protein
MGRHKDPLTVSLYIVEYGFLTQEESEDFSLDQEKNYLSNIIIGLLWKIIGNLYPYNMINLSKVSKYFNFYVNKIIPPEPINIEISNSIEIVNHIGKMEQYKKNYDEVKFHFSYDICDTNDHLDNLAKALEIVPYSLHFGLHNGPERIEKLCQEKEKSNTMKSYCSSIFRDPYYFLLVITIMILLTVILGWFIHTRTFFNINEEPILKKNFLENEINKVKENGLSNEIFPVDSVFKMSNSVIFDRKTHYCFNRYQEKDLLDYYICLDKDELYKNVHNLTNNFFDSFSIDYKTSRLQVRHILSRFLIFLRKYGLVSIGFLHEYEKSKFVLFRIFKIFSGKHDESCLHLDGNIRKIQNDKISIAIDRFLVDYDPECVIKKTIQYPYFHLDIWYLIFILCFIWIIFIISFLYAIF